MTSTSNLTLQGSQLVSWKALLHCCDTDIRAVLTGVSPQDVSPQESAQGLNDFDALVEWLEALAERYPEVHLTFSQANVAQKALSYPETIAYLETQILEGSSPNRDILRGALLCAREQEGPTLFDWFLMFLEELPTWTVVVHP